MPAIPTIISVAALVAAVVTVIAFFAVLLFYIHSHRPSVLAARYGKYLDKTKRENSHNENSN